MFSIVEVYLVSVVIVPGVVIVLLFEVSANDLDVVLFNFLFNFFLC